MKYHPLFVKETNASIRSLPFSSDWHLPSIARFHWRADLKRVAVAFILLLLYGSIHGFATDHSESIHGFVT